MRKHLYSLLILVGLISASCSDTLYDEANYQSASTYIILTPEEYTSIAYDNPKELTQSEVYNVVKEFQTLNSTMNNEMITRTSNVPNIAIIKKYHIQQDSINTPALIATRNKVAASINVPIFELEISKANNKKDFAVVCADERAPKVLFYANDYFPDSEMDIHTKFLLELSKKNILSEIENIERIKVEKKESTLKKISKKFNIPENQISYNKLKNQILTTDEVSTKSTNNPPGGVGKPTRIISFVNPLSKITWDQTYPYNLQMPIGPRHTMGKNYEILPYYVGCANVAVATVFSILKPAITGTLSTGQEVPIDWDYVTSVPSIKDSYAPKLITMVTTVLRKIYDETHSYPVYEEMTVYNEDIEEVKMEIIVSTETKAIDMINYLSKMMTFSGDITTTFNANLAKNSLYAKKPVLLFGSGHYVDNNYQTPDKYKEQHPGHAWVIDGYFMTKSSGQVTNDHYWSVNMGWGTNLSKGYFRTQDNFQDCDIIFNNGDINIVYYTQEQCMLYNFAKKY